MVIRPSLALSARIAQLSNPGFMCLVSISHSSVPAILLRRLAQRMA
jgi:hypothetical protein